jgi:hypothetical protein
VHFSLLVFESVICVLLLRSVSLVLLSIAGAVRPIVTPDGVSKILSGIS